MIGFKVPDELRDELAAHAAFRGVTTLDVVKRFITIGLLLSRGHAVLCMVDEVTGDHHEIDTDADEMEP